MSSEDWIKDHDIGVDESIMMIGYGSFMTEALTLYRGVMESKTYGVDIKIVKPIHVKGYRRVSQPHSAFPYVIKDKDCSFWGLAFEVKGGHNLRRLDNVEGVPRHYVRETVKIDGKKYFMYVASKETQESYIKYLIRELDKSDDFWYTRVYLVLLMNQLAIDSGIFDDLMSKELVSNVVLKWADMNYEDDEDLQNEDE